MKQEELERRITESARDYNEPPEPPREEMWAAIRPALPRGQRPRRPVRRLPAWTPWAVGLAAMMVAGFGLGRVTGPTAAGPGPMASTEGESAESGPSLSVRMAAADHLGEAEALLTLFRSTGRSEDRAVTARWARDLLITTRVMIDSRAGSDPALAQLLADLELVLVQIASATADRESRELIEDGIEERQLLVKLRSATPAAGMSL